MPDGLARLAGAAAMSLAGPGQEAMLETTPNHVGPRDHFKAFDAPRQACFEVPYPAWAAVEATALRRPGAVFEMRVVASAA